MSRTVAGEDDDKHVGRPSNVMRHVHVEWDPKTGTFTVSLRLATTRLDIKSTLREKEFVGVHLCVL